MKKHVLLLLFSAVLLVFAVTSCAGKASLLQEEGSSDPEKKAVKLIREGKAECVLLKNGKIIHIERGRGVSPLLRIYETYPEKMKGSRVVDKVIGRAAGMILILAL